MASRELKVEIIGDASSLHKALGKATDSSSKFGKTLATLGKAAVVGLGALGVGAAIAGKHMISLASDAEEVQSKMEVVFGKELPKLTKNLDEFSEATGASKFQLREQVADMGALLEPLTANKKAAADMSSQFVKLATDLGSFNNVPVDEALLAIRSGLVGEAEPLRRFGVLLNEAAVNAEGVRMGLIKTGETMTEQQKVQARGNLIMAQTTLAQGDAERTSGSMANQMKRLKNSLTDAATEMGQKLLPAALSVVKAFNEHWPEIEKIVDKVMDGLVVGVTAAVTAVQTHFQTIKTVITSALSGALDIGKKLVAFFSTDFGQKLAAAAVSTLIFSKSFIAVKAAIASTQLALSGLAKNPFFIAMIPIGIAVGVLAQRFIKAKVDAANFAAGLQQAAGSADALKASLDRLNSSETALESSKLALIRANQQAAVAEAAWHKAVKESGAGSKEARAAYLTHREALNGVKAATDGVTTATKENKDATSERNTVLTQGTTKLRELTKGHQEVARGTIVSEHAAKSFADSLRANFIPNAQEAANKAKKMGDEAGTQAQTKLLSLAKAAVTLADRMKAVPTMTEIVAFAKLKGLPGFQGDVKKVEKALTDAGSNASGWGFTIGSNLGSGIKSGINAVLADVAAAAAAAVNRIVESMRGAAAAHSDSEKTKQLGRDLSHGLLMGYLEGTRDLPEKMSEPLRKSIERMATTIHAQEARLSTAFQQLAGDAMTAFDAATTAGLDKIQKKLDAKLKQIGDRLSAALKKIDIAQAVQTPAEKALAQLDRSEQVRGMVTSLQDAQQALAAAQSGVGFEAKEDETPEQAAERVRRQGEAILAAQEQLRTAQLSIQRDALQQQAERERAAADARAEAARVKAEKAAAAETLRAQKQAGNQSLQYQAQRDLQQRHLQKMLDNLEEKLLQGDIKWSQAHKRVMLAFKDEFGPDLATAGKNLGTAFAKGLKESIGGVGSAAADLAKQIAKYLKLGSPTELGPMSDLDIWWSTLGSTLASGVDYESVTSVGQRIGKTLADSFATDSGAFSGLWDKLIGGGFAGSEAAAGVKEGNTALGDFTETTDGLYQSVALLGRQMPVAFEAIATALEKQIPRALVPLEAFWSALVHIIEAFQGIVHWAGEAQESIDSMGGGGGGGGGTHPQRDVPWLAGGGIVMKPMTAVLGEAGPEAVIPLSRTNSMAGVNINLTVHGSVTSERDLVTSIRNALVQEGRRSGGNLLGGYA